MYVLEEHLMEPEEEEEGDQSGLEIHYNSKCILNERLFLKNEFSEKSAKKEIFFIFGALSRSFFFSRNL